MGTKGKKVRPSNDPGEITQRLGTDKDGGGERPEFPGTAKKEK
jgi:hypothetical protein